MIQGDEYDFREEELEKELTEEEEDKLIRNLIRLLHLDDRQMPTN